MRFSKLAADLQDLDKTASRNAMIKFLAYSLSQASEKEIDKLCYLLLGELAPAYRGLEFQIAEKMMIQALAEVYHRTTADIGRSYKTKGDLGDVAYELGARAAAGKQRLTVEAVYDALEDIAKEQGKGSQERKIRKMADLLASLDRISAKYVSRIPIGKLRLGFSDATLLDALSFMIKGDKSARPQIERAYNVTADIGQIAHRIKQRGLGALARLEAQPGVPIRPSLAERLTDITDIFTKVGREVGVEQKLDGFRTQIHVWKENGTRRAALFSRNLENTTFMFPEITRAARGLKVQSAILDGETIGYYPRTGRFAPFQETVQRKRKHGIEELAKKIPLAVFIFDIMHLDGRSLIGLPFTQRRKALEKLLGAPRPTGAIRLASHRVTSEPEVVIKALKESVSQGLEGLVVKNLQAGYEAGSRGFHWVKLKATTAALEKLRAGASPGQLPDTIDCLIMGAYRGRGKRAQFGVGGFLLGVRGPDERYYTISRLGTGLSDQQFRDANRQVKALTVKEQPKDYVAQKDSAPDIWIRPALVAEILADEITLSPRHTAGRKKDGTGYSLRFPRLVRLRADKKPEDATTVEEIEKMHRQQKRST